MKKIIALIFVLFFAFNNVLFAQYNSNYQADSTYGTIRIIPYQERVLSGYDSDIFIGKLTTVIGGAFQVTGLTIIACSCVKEESANRVLGISMAVTGTFIEVMGLIEWHKAVKLKKQRQLNYSPTSLSISF
jgi:hypothetical protein